MKMQDQQFSVFSATMSKVPIDEVVSLVSTHGFDAIEWGVGYPNLSEEQAFNDAQTIKKMCSDAGLKISCVSGGPLLSQMEKIKKIIDVAHHMDTRLFRVIAPWYGFNNEETAQHKYQDLFSKSMEELSVIEEICKKEDVKAVIETHFGNICPSPSLAHNLVKHFDSRYIGIIYDPGNMVVEGMENSKMAIEIMGDYLAHVHVKNIIWGWIDRDWQNNLIPLGWNWKITNILEGMVNWENVTKHLMNFGYKGYLSWEDFSTTDINSKLSVINKFKEFIAK